MVERSFSLRFLSRQRTEQPGTSFGGIVFGVRRRMWRPFFFKEPRGKLKR
jgi:hypothetical protein